MKIEVPENSSSASFLDRKESDFVRFVKYHGLGNDFILVIHTQCSILNIAFSNLGGICE